MIFAKKNASLVVAVLASALWGSEAHAGLVLWSALEQISGDSDVVNIGTTDRAYLFAADPGPNATINGVVFKEFNQNKGSDTSTFTNAFTGDFGNTSAPPTPTSVGTTSFFSVMGFTASAMELQPRLP